MEYNAASPVINKTCSAKSKTYDIFSLFVNLPLIYLVSHSRRVLRPIHPHARLA